MRKINLSVKLWSIVRVTLGLVLCLQPSYASDQREEEETLQPQCLSKIQDSEFKAPEASYGDFDLLSEDILFHQILPHCDRTIIQVNRSLFTLVTGYTSDHIFDQGFESKPIKPICCLRGHTVFDFNKHRHHIEQMPSFVWYSLMRGIKNIPSDHWLYLKKTQVHTVDLSWNKIEAIGARDFGQSLKGTQVQFVDLSWNRIQAAGARDFGQSLKGTQIQFVSLSNNLISADSARDFGQSLKGTQVQTVDLSYNLISADSARDFGQSLKGTQVQTVDLSYNQIGDDGAKALAQGLKETQVQMLCLSRNNITSDMQVTLKDMLPGVDIEF